MSKRDLFKVMAYMDDHPCCEVSGVPCLNEPHHIKTVGSGGNDEHDNLIKLSWVLHRECHIMGNHQFAIKHKVTKIRQRLDDLGLWKPEHERRWRSAHEK